MSFIFHLCSLLLLSSNWTNSCIFSLTSCACALYGCTVHYKRSKKNICFYRANICKGSLGVVILSVCPSVCLSHACIVTKLNDALLIFLYHTKGQSLCTLIITVVCGRLLFPLKSAFKVAHPLRKMPTSTDFR